MDILIMMRDFAINFISGLPENITDFVLRMGLLLVISALALSIALKKLPWEEVLIQLCVAFLSIVISLYLPVNEIRNLGKETLASTVIISFICMLFLPEKLPSYLTPMLGNQIRLKGIIKNIIWGLFILQLILGVRK